MTGESRAQMIGAYVAYLFCVTLFLAFISPILYSTDYSAIPISSPTVMSDSLNFAANGSIPSNVYVTSGGWRINDNGLTSNDSGTEPNTVYFIKNPKAIDVMFYASVRNPQNKEFSFYGYDNTALFVAHDRLSWKFTSTGVSRIVESSQYFPFADISVSNETPYPIGFNQTSFQLSLVSNGEEWKLSLNGKQVGTYSTGNDMLKTGIFSTKYSAGFETLGDGFSIYSYSLTAQRSTDIVTMGADFIQSLLYIVAFTLPPWLFVDPAGFWIFAVIDVVFVKIPLIQMFFMITEWRS